MDANRKRLDQTPPEVPQEEDDYGDDDFQKQEDNKEQKKHVRGSTITSATRDPADQELDQIFIKFKSHIQKQNRKIYEEQCRKHDSQGFQYLSLSAYYRILVNMGDFSLTSDQLKRLLIAIQAYSGDRDDRVQYNIVIRAILERQVMAHSGKFAKRQAPTTFPDTQTTASYIQENFRSIKERGKQREQKRAKNQPKPTQPTTLIAMSDDEKQASQTLDEITRKYQAQKKIARNLNSVFQLYDLNKNGKVNYDSLKNALLKANIFPVINKEVSLRKLYDALNFQEEGDQIAFAPLIDAIQNQKKLREIRSTSGQMINISSFLGGQRQEQNMEEAGGISSPTIKRRQEHELEQSKKSIKPTGNTELESMAVRSLPQIKQALQQLLQEIYPSRHHLDTVVFGEVEDEDILELEVFQKQLDPKITQNLSNSELRKVHEAECMMKANNKKDFLDIIWGENHKFEYQGKILSIEAGEGASGGPPTFKPGTSDGKFFSSQDSALHSKIDKSLDRNLKEMCETLDRQSSEANRPLEQLLRYNINEDEEVVKREKGGQDGFTFSEFQDFYSIFLSDRDPSIAKSLFELLVTPSTDKKPILLIKDLMFAIQSRRPAMNIILRIQKFLENCGRSAIGNAKRKDFQQKLQNASAEFNGKLIQLATLQRILNEIGIHAIQADLVFLRTQGLTRSPQDFRSIDVTEAIQNTSITPGHAKRRADCVDLIELLKRSKPQPSEVQKEEEFSKIQEIERLEQNFLTKQDQKAKLEAVLNERKDQLGKRGAKSTDRGTSKSGLSKMSEGKKTGGKSLNQKIKGIIKVPQKIVDSKAKQQLYNDFKQSFVYPLISKVIAHGESILFGRQVQHKFQNRAVLKSLFPSAIQIKNQVNGILPRSLTGYDKLGRILYLDGENKLQQISVTAGNEERLKAVGLGTRPPLKFHPIIDLACDRKSGRIYTLNRNWVLEVWNIEQTQTVPIARLTVVNKDVRQDYINKSYPKRYFGSKPIFLALNEQNRQVLIINTSCVDGSFVFIDPISMSVFKRIRLNYSEYEPDKEVMESLAQFVVHIIKTWNGSLQNFTEQVFIYKQSQSFLRRKSEFSGIASPSSFASPDKYNDSFGVTFSARNKGSRLSGAKSSQKEANNVKLKGFEIKFNALVNAFQQECNIKFEQASQLALHLDKRMSGQIRFQDLQKAFGKMEKKLGISQNDDQETKVRKAMNFNSANSDQNDHNLLKTERTGTIILSERGSIGTQNEQSLKWPDWIVNEGRVQEVKKTLFSIANIIEQNNIELNSAFIAFDIQNLGYIEEKQFESILHKLLPTLDSDQIDLIFRLIDRNEDSYISYKEFCRYISPQAIKVLRQQTSDQDTREILQQPIEKEATLKYVLRRCHEVGINLKKIFLGKDEAKVNILPKMTFQRILKSLPLGFMDEEIDQLMQSQISFDGKGNVDYTQILNSEFYVSLERIRDQMKLMKRRQQLKERPQNLQTSQSQVSPNINIDQANTPFGNKVSQLELSKITQNQAPYHQADGDEFQGFEAQKSLQQPTATSDSRKVVVEDLCYIGDLDLIAYTTVQPRTSSVFISQAIAVNVQSAAGLLPSPTVHSAAHTIQNQDAITQQKYQMLAILQAHKNEDPPTIKYIAESGCLVSGQKSMAKDRNVNQSPQKQPHESTQGGGYENFIKHGGGGPACFQIIVWNIQRDMIELFQSKQIPWRVAPARRFNAFNGSILDICYLRQAQLLACSSTDHTIRFFDPTAKPYALCDPQNIPHVKIKPGQYKPMQVEYTQKNQPFSEVNRFYTKDAICYSLSTVVIDVPSSNTENTKNQIGAMRVEWLLNLRLTKSQNISSHMVMNQGDLICNAIERMQIEVPVNRHDDPVPANVFRECKMMMEKRRKLGVARFKADIHRTLDKTLSHVTVQRAMFQEIQKLLKRSALLGRDSGSGGMSQQQLREVYRMLTTLPERGKFSAFLSQFGDKKQLSISEAFHSLSKLCQISPGRTTQLEFEKSVSDFYHKNEQSLINDGSRQWGNIALQKLANYIRHNGIDIESMMHFAPSMSDRFLTRDGMKAFMRQSCGLQKQNSGGFMVQYLMDESQFESVIQALDPYMFDRIPFKSIQEFFKEQISAYCNSADEKPKKIISEIRNKLIPQRKLQLQQALQRVDQHGDGYISLHQFLRAFQISQIGYDRQLLRQLFYALSESYSPPINTQQPHQQQQQQQHFNSKFSHDDLRQNTLSRLGIKNATSESQKMMSVTYFMEKLFNEKKDGDMHNIARVLTLLKAGLIYRGIKFQNIFAEESGLNYLDDEVHLQEDQSQGKSGSRQGKKSTNSNRNSTVDMTMHSRKIATQITKEEFIRRINELAITDINEVETIKLANFISINSSNKQVIQLDHFLHFIKRVESAAYPSVLTGKRLIPIICAKLTSNKHLFKKSCQEVGDFGPTTRQDQKILQETDVRSVLLLFSIPHSHIERFLAEICRSQPIHINDLMTKIEFQVNDYFKLESEPHQDQDESLPYNIQQNINQRVIDLKQTEYFRKLRKATANSMIDQEKIIQLFEQFDAKKSGKIKIHHLINVLKYNLGENAGLDDYILAGLQFQLESISQDNTVDYLEFFQIFLQHPQHNESNIGGLNRSYVTMHSSFLGQGLEGQAIADSYTKEDIQHDLIRLSHYIKDGGLSIRDAFTTFNRNRDGKITQQELREAFRLIDFQVESMEAMWRYLDLDGNGWLSIDELARKIVYAKDVKDDFDPQKWILAAKNIQSTDLLRKLAYNLGGLRAALKRVIQKTKNVNETEFIQLIVMGKHLEEALQKSGLGFSVQEIEQLVTFGILGSRRVGGGTVDRKGASKSHMMAIQESKNSFQSDSIRLDQKSQNKIKQQKTIVPPPRIDLQTDLILTQNFFKSLDIVISQREYQENTHNPHQGSKNIINSSQVQNNSTLGSMSRSIQGDQHISAQNAAKEEADNFVKIQKSLSHEEYLLVEKLQAVFTEREFSFYDSINDIYVQSDERTKFLLMKDFNARIKSLSLPLSVRDYRRLLHIADPEQNGKINILRFIKLFENSKIRQKRLEGLIKKCAMLFYLDYSKGEEEKGQILDQLFDQFKLFDADDDGLLSRGEFHSAIRQFGLGLSSLQIDDLIRINEYSDEGYLNYQDFIHNFRSKLLIVEKDAKRQMEGFLLIRIKELLQSKDQSLYRILQKYDVSNKGQILGPFVEKALIALGMKNLSLKQVLLILQMGGFTDSTIKIDKFCRKIYQNIDREMNQLTEVAFGLIREIYRIIRGRGLSIFETFCSFDTSLKLRITKLEFMANIHQLSIKKEGNNFEKLWNYIARSKNKTLLKSQISYHTFLRAFIQAGTLKLQKQSETIQIGESGTIKKFFLQLKKTRLTPDKFWQKADTHNIGTLSAFQFASACKRNGIVLSSTEMELCFNQMIDKSAEGKMMQRKNDNDPSSSNTIKRVLTFKILTEAFTRNDSQANVILQTARKMEAYVLSKASQGMTWKRIFQGTSENAKSSAASSGKSQLTLKELRQKLKSIRFGLSNQNIDHLLNFISFPRDGHLSPAAFEDQLGLLIHTHQQKIDSVNNRLKEISMQVRQAIDRDNVPFERVFAECDEEQIGCLNVLQFINFLSAFGVSAKKDEVKLIFQTISAGRTHIELEKVKSFISGSIFHAKQLGGDEQNKEDHQASENFLEKQEKRNEMFERIREKLKEKGLHLQFIVKSISLSMKEFLTVKALKQIMLKAELILSKREASFIIAQMTESFGRSELQVKDLIEFMLRKKVDTIDVKQGASQNQIMDPAIILTVSSMQKAFKKFQIPLEKAFQLLQKSSVNELVLNRADFILAIEGMQLGLSYDDLLTLFNFIDQRRTGTLQKQDFLDVFKFVLAAANGIQLATTRNQNEQQGPIKRKQMTKKQQLMHLLKTIGTKFEEKGVSFRQMSSYFDKSKTGLISRAEFAEIIRNFKLGMDLENVRKIAQHFDQNGTGIIQVSQVLANIQEIMNQGSDGLYSLIQSRPILHKIMASLGSETGRFLDELASIERPLFSAGNRRGLESALTTKTGISRKEFMQILQNFRIKLTEDEISLIISAFAYSTRPHMLDIHRLFSVFDSFSEAQNLRNATNSAEFKKSVIRKIALHLKRNNITIMECFSSIDQKNNGLVSNQEMVKMLEQLGAGLSLRDATKLIELFDESKKGMISLNSFLRNFWSAYSVSMGSMIGDQLDEQNEQG